MDKEQLKRLNGRVGYAPIIIFISLTVVIALSVSYFVSKITVADEAESPSATNVNVAFNTPSPTSVPENGGSSNDGNGGKNTSTEVYNNNCDSVVIITTYVTQDGADTAYGMGSGFFVTEDGYIITNSHLLKDIDKASVELYNGNVYDTVIVGYDEKTEIGVLKVDSTEKFKAVTMGDSDKLNVGEDAYAIGIPMGYEFTLSVGHISGLEREVRKNNYTYSMIQVDISLNNGNSGGPLFDCNGYVIGVNTMKEASSYTVVEGIGFAVPINIAANIAEQLIKDGKVTRAAFNATVGNAYSGDEAAGAVIAELVSGGAAEKAGLKVNDIIVGIDDAVITSVADLLEQIELYSPGDSAKLTIIRDNEKMQIDFVFGTT